jgi:myo-inositol-1(or 4)-monophosphatase
MASQSALINVMQKASIYASKGLLRDFGEVENLQVSRKGPAISSAAPTSMPRRRSGVNCQRPGPTGAFTLKKAALSRGDRCPRLGG